MTDKLRAAAQAALEALINGKNVRAGEGGTKRQTHLEDAAIEQLRAALAEPEPVAWLYTNVQSGDMEASTDPDWFDDGRELWNSQPLYTHPPRREWVSLTDEEIASLSDNVQFGSRMAKLARIIEAALKEKNT